MMASRAGSSRSIRLAACAKAGRRLPAMASPLRAASSNMVLRDIPFELRMPIPPYQQGES